MTCHVVSLHPVQLYVVFLVALASVLELSYPRKIYQDKQHKVFVNLEEDLVLLALVYFL